MISSKLIAISLAKTNFGSCKVFCYTSFSKRLGKNVYVLDKEKYIQSEDDVKTIAVVMGLSKWGYDSFESKTICYDSDEPHGIMLFDLSSNDICDT